MIRPRRDGVVIVLQRDRRFLVGQRAPHKPAPYYWTQISGKREPGESLEQTVVREAREEIGCTVEVSRSLQSLPSANGKFMLHYFAVEIIEGEPSICDDELLDLRWVTVAELIRLKPNFQEDLDLLTRLTEEAANGG